MTQQWDFPVDEPVSLPQWRRDRLSEHLPSIAIRIERGETVRTIAAAYGISHEALRQALKRRGHATRSSPVPATAPRRVRAHRLPGRGRSTALTPDEVGTLLLRHRAGESIRFLARATGVSHEAMRQMLGRASQAVAQAASA